MTFFSRRGRPACLIVTNNFPPAVGGAGEVYAALARHGGGRVRVLCARIDYRTGGGIAGWRAHDAGCGFPVHRIARVRTDLVRTGVASDLAVRVRVAARVAWLCARHGVGVVCVADDEVVGWLAGVVRRLGRAVLLYSHGDDLAERAGEVRLRARRRRQFAAADAVVAVSEAAAAGLGRVFGVPRGRIEVVPNGYDAAVFRPLPRDPAMLDVLGLTGKRVVMTVARLVARKGVDRVIDALRELADPTVRYVVVGDGPERAALETRAAGMDAVFVGAVPHGEVPRYLALADVMAMPNRRLADGEDEGFGLVFLEAQACGVPVIAGRAGGAPEVVRDGETGLLVDGDDAADVARALGRVLDDAALARRLAAGGLAAAADATWARRTAAFLAVCDRIG